MKIRSKMARKKITAGFETRAQILESFLLISYPLGPENITLQRLAEASQVTLGPVLYYSWLIRIISLYEAALVHLLEKAYQAIIPWRATSMRTRLCWKELGLVFAASSTMI